MAKLYFQYWAMGAWKSLELIKVAYNYTERWKKVIVFNSKLDTRFTNWEVASRSWSKIASISFDDKTDLYYEITKTESRPDCVLVDESQFLKKKQVEECAKIVTEMNIPVICYWLRTDFLWNLFEWSKRLMEIAQKIEEIKTICWCWDKATMNARISEWKMCTAWDQIEIWENDRYISLCLKHYNEWKLMDK